MYEPRRRVTFNGAVEVGGMDSGGRAMFLYFIRNRIRREMRYIPVQILLCRRSPLG